MKKITLGLIASLLLLPVISFAQTLPPAPDSWVAFQKVERAKKVAFYKQMRADVDTFLRDHPDAKEYLTQVRAYRKARAAAKKASL